MLDKINGTKPTILIIDPDQKLTQEQIEKIWKMCEPIANIESNYPLLFGTKQPDYTNPCLNCKNNPLNNPFASGFCNCSLPSRNITY